MVSACILVCCEPGQYKTVTKAIKGIKGVTKAFPTTGRWDVIAEADLGDLKDLSYVALKINGMPGVRASETLVEVTM